MKKLIFLLLAAPFITLAQGNTAENNSPKNKILLSEDMLECVNSVYDNPEAIKYLLQNLAGDKEKFRTLFRQIVNDPAMKDVVRELKNAIREDRGMLEKSRKLRNNINKENSELTFRE